MEIREIKNKKVWEKFIFTYNPWSFFQSWDWGEVEKRLGKKVFRLGFLSGNEFLSIAQIIKTTSKRGAFFHLRHGPVFKDWKSEDLNVLVSEIKKMAQREKVIFARFSPTVPPNHFLDDWYKKNKLVKFPIPDLDAQRCWILPLLNKDEEELLLSMRKTTRYLIRKAEKIGVRVKTGDGNGMKIFLNLYRQTAQRQHFIPHQGIKEEGNIFGKDDKAKIFLAEYQGKILAGALVVFWGKQAIYRHGASVASDIPASYLVQWGAIQEAKKRGMEFYNFWGIASEDKPNHPWRGLTLFKKGFGGEEKIFSESRDLPLSSLYFFSYLIDFFRKIYRRY